MDQYKVVIDYHSGRRKSQTIAIDGIDPDDIIEILGEITQEQLANAEIIVFCPCGNQLFLEDYLLIRFTCKTNVS